MNFETVKIKEDVHVSVNGVVSSAYARESTNGEWVIMIPQIAYSVPTEREAIRRIAEALGNWYTTAEAAERLVELGAFDEAPTAHDVCMWARLDLLLPGAVKILGKGAMGRGGSWRIPESALAEFTKRRGQ